MSFASLQFLLFLFLVVSIYWSLPSRTSRKVWLLLSSYVFYGAWDYRFLLLIWVSTAVDYLVGLGLRHAERYGTRRFFLWLSCLSNLGLLAYFKYANFFVDSAIRLARQVGFPVSDYELNIILPVGISFYTFQTLSYTIDVFRRKISTCSSLLDFALFVAFFPQLMAGPIVRASHFLPQVQQPKRFSRIQTQTAVYLITKGLFKKVVIGDSLGFFVGNVYGQPELFGFWACWFAVCAFLVQIYCDFSGYSDIAIGLAKLFGYELPINFRAPFMAQSFSEFWQRWHISLSTWLRDYLYQPLRRNFKWGIEASTFFTMLMVGLWHGASWSFVLWGGGHGLLLIAERRRWFPRKTGGVLGSWVQRAFVFLGVSFSVGLFQMGSLQSIFCLYEGLLGLRGWHSTTDVRLSVVWLLLLVGVGQVYGNNVRSWLNSLERKLWVRVAWYTACVASIFIFWESPEAFVYFQF